MITVVVPYYDQPAMLRTHCATWLAYSDAARQRLKLVVVDDGSPRHPADDVVAEYLELFPASAGLDVSVYRILEDIPWNRGGARNLGARVATTPWLLHLDVDHVLSADHAERLALGTRLDAGRWYRFRRYRVGRADSTRRKDALPPDAEFGEVKPHGDSYLVERELYWRVGGYDEDYSGCLGGGSPFLKQLEKAAPMQVLDVALHVHTKHAVPDANVESLSRDTTEYTRRRKAKEAAGKTRAANPLRFTWEKQL